MAFPPSDSDWPLVHRRDGRALLLRTLAALDARSRYTPVLVTELQATLGRNDYPRRLIAQSLRRLEAQHAVVCGRGGRVVLTQFGRVVLDALRTQERVDMPALGAALERSACSLAGGMTLANPVQSAQRPHMPTLNTTHGEPVLHRDPAEATELVVVTAQRCHARCLWGTVVWTVINRQADAAAMVEESAETSGDETVVLYRAPDREGARTFRAWVQELTDDVPTERCHHLHARYVTAEGWATEYLVDPSL